MKQERMIIHGILVVQHMLLIQIKMKADGLCMLHLDAVWVIWELQHGLMFMEQEHSVVTQKVGGQLSLKMNMALREMP